MRRIRSLLRLPWADRLLLAEALLVVVPVRVGLWLLPFRWWRPLLNEVSAQAGGATSIAPERVAWAVRAAARRVPAASCLTQALTTRLMLGRRGRHARVRIGIAHGRAGQFEAHAWVESEGRTIIGGTDASLARYRVFPSTSSKP